MADRVLGLPTPIGVLADSSVSLDDVELLHLHWPEWFGFDDPAVHTELIARLAERGIPIVWTAHNLTPHARQPEIYDPIYQQWADVADAVIHHSEWGKERMLARYSFRPECRHEVLVHGHFGDLWPAAATTTRAAAESRLGLAPAALRIGLVGAPREDKKVVEFLEGVAGVQPGRHPGRVLVAAPRQDRAGRSPHRDRRAVPQRRSGDVRDTTRSLRCPRVPLRPRRRHARDRNHRRRHRGRHPRVDLRLDLPHRDARRRRDSLRPHRGEVATALDGLTDDDVARARAAIQALKPAFEWAPIAERTADLFERVVLDEP